MALFSLECGTGRWLWWSLGSLVAVLGTCPPAHAQRGEATAQPAPTRYTVPGLVQQMAPGVVNITLMDASGKPAITGSGFVVDAGGVIVTAYHLVREAKYGATLKTDDEEVYDAIDVIHSDVRRDLAILKIQPFRPLKALTLASDNELIVGEDAAALGNPQGLEASVSAGIVSGYRQADGFRLIQTTVPVSPGSSGGPLFNMAGKVIGMVTSGIDNARGQNLNFAIPVIYIGTLLKGTPVPTPIATFAVRSPANNGQAGFNPAGTEPPSLGQSIPRAPLSTSSFQAAAFQFFGCFEDKARRRAVCVTDLVPKSSSSNFDLPAPVLTLTEGSLSISAEAVTDLSSQELVYGRVSSARVANQGTTQRLYFRFRLPPASNDRAFSLKQRATIDGRTWTAEFSGTLQVVDSTAGAEAQLFQPAQ